jgi:hypothetical protein
MNGQKIDMVGAKFSFSIVYHDDGQRCVGVFECIEWTDEKRVFQQISGPHPGSSIEMDWAEYIDQSMVGRITLIADPVGQ